MFDLLYYFLTRRWSCQRAGCKSCLLPEVCRSYSGTERKIILPSLASRKQPARYRMSATTVLWFLCGRCTVDLVVFSLSISCGILFFSHVCFFVFIIVGENQRTGGEAGAAVSMAPLRPLVPWETTSPWGQDPGGPPRRLWGQLWASVALSFCLRVAVSVSVLGPLGSAGFGEFFQGAHEPRPAFASPNDCAKVSLPLWENVRLPTLS